MAENFASNEANKMETDVGWWAAGVLRFKVHGQQHAFDKFPVKHAKERK